MSKDDLVYGHICQPVVILQHLQDEKSYLKARKTTKKSRFIFSLSLSYDLQNSYHPSLDKTHVQPPHAFVMFVCFICCLLVLNQMRPVSQKYQSELMPCRLQQVPGTWSGNFCRYRRKQSRVSPDQQDGFFRGIVGFHNSFLFPLLLNEDTRGKKRNRSHISFPVNHHKRKIRYLLKCGWKRQIPYFYQVRRKQSEQVKPNNRSR
jgi:hypothetical protein